MTKFERDFGNPEAFSARLEIAQDAVGIQVERTQQRYPQRVLNTLASISGGPHVGNSLDLATKAVAIEELTNGNRLFNEWEASGYRSDANLTGAAAYTTAFDLLDQLGPDHALPGFMKAMIARGKKNEETMRSGVPEKGWDKINISQTLRQIDQAMERQFGLPEDYDPDSRSIFDDDPDY